MTLFADFLGKRGVLVGMCLPFGWYLLGLTSHLPPSGWFSPTWAFLILARKDSPAPKLSTNILHNCLLELSSVVWQTLYICLLLMHTQSYLWEDLLNKYFLVVWLRIYWISIFVWPPTWHSFSWQCTSLVDPASSHMLVSKIKPCMSQYKLLYGETANGSLKQL